MPGRRSAERYAAAGLPAITVNAAAPANVIEDVAQLDAAGRMLVREAAERMGLSARGFHRVLKLARTIADLEGRPEIGRAHLAEALSYRAETGRQTRAA